MDSNFWFYTLSAIPQTLGALIALTATFVIFKLNHIEERTKQEYNEIKEWIMPLLPEIEIHEITKLNDDGMLQKLKEGIRQLKPDKLNLGFDGYDKLSRLYEDVISDYKRFFKPTEQRIYEYLIEKERVLTSLIQVRKNALRKLLKSLLLTLIPLVGSIIFLPLYNAVNSLAFIIVLIFISLAVIAIIYTAYSVWKIARPQLR